VIERVGLYLAAEKSANIPLESGSAGDRAAAGDGALAGKIEKDGARFFEDHLNSSEVPFGDLGLDPNVDFARG